ncbi:hypothetical protein ACJX0J_011861 [Zea mays]
MKTTKMLFKVFKKIKKPKPFFEMKKVDENKIKRDRNICEMIFYPIIHTQTQNRSRFQNFPGQLMLIVETQSGSSPSDQLHAFFLQTWKYLLNDIFIPVDHQLYYEEVNVGDFSQDMGTLDLC